MQSTACLCPTHSSASPLLRQDLLYNPCKPAPAAAHCSDSHFQTNQCIASSWQHRPCASRWKLLGQCRSLGWRERGKLNILHSRGWTCGPKIQTQNVNTCGNAGTPCLTQKTSWLAGAALWPSIQRWDDDHAFTSSSHLLPHPALPGTGLSSSAHQNAISFTFPTSLKLPPVSKAQLPSYQTSPFIHKLIQ